MRRRSRSAAFAAVLAGCVAACGIRDAGPDFPPPTDAGAHDAGRADGGPPPFDAGQRVFVPDIPRMVGPLTTSRVGTHEPTLRVTTRDTDVRIEIEVCADHGCGSPRETLDAVGGAAQPARELPAGIWFWRARAVRDSSHASAWSRAWWLSVPRAASSVDTARGGVVDVDGDGLGDLAAIIAPGGGSERLELRRGRRGAPLPETADFVAPHPTSPFAAMYGGSIVAGDFDGNGYVDVAVTGGTNILSSVVAVGGALYVFAAQPSGVVGVPITTLRAPATEVHDYFQTVVSVGDADRDGYADVVGFGDSGPEGARLHLHRGGPSWLAQTSASDLVIGAGTAPPEYLGDVDGDGYPDLLAVVGGALAVVPLRGAFDATAVVPLVSPTGTSWSGSAIGDIDGDGYDDVAVRTSASDSYVLRGGPGGVDAAHPVRLPFRRSEIVFRLGDVDGNGCEDFFGESLRERTDRLVDACSGEVRAWSLPTFGASRPDRTVFLAARADMDGDGLDDVVRASQYTYATARLYRSPFDFNLPDRRFRVVNTRGVLEGW